MFYSLSSFGIQIELQTGEVIEAKKTDLPSALGVTLENGQHQSIQMDEIQSIVIKERPRITPLIKQKTTLSQEEVKNALDEFRELKPFETPKQTFLTWKQKAEEGSIDGMVECYASFRQKDVRKQLKNIKRKERNEMQNTMRMMSFVASDPLYQENQAYLEVTWTKGLQSENQVLKFVQENQEWKIIE